MIDNVVCDYCMSIVDKDGNARCPHCNGTLAHAKSVRDVKMGAVIHPHTSWMTGSTAWPFSVSVGEDGPEIVRGTL